MGGGGGGRGGGGAGERELGLGGGGSTAGWSRRCSSHTKSLPSPPGSTEPLSSRCHHRWEGRRWWLEKMRSRDEDEDEEEGKQWWKVAR